MSSLDHMHESIRPMMQWTAGRRAWQMLIPRFIEDDELRPIMLWLNFEMRRPHQREARGKAVFGLPGAGKSMLATAVQRRYPPSSSETANHATQRVALISMTGAREAKTIEDRLLQSLGVPNFSNYRRDERELMTLKACRAAQVRLLILDELQDVLTSTPRQHQIALDTIKFLMNQLGVSILALGTKRVPAALLVDEHLNARFGFRELSPWQSGDRLRRFLAAFERSLPLASPSHLASPEMAALLAALSSGTLRKLAELLSFAAAHAAETGTEKIDQAMLELAMDRPPIAALTHAQDRDRDEEVFLAA